MRNSEAIIQDAFKCFWPSLDEHEKQLVRRELVELAKNYQEDLAASKNDVVCNITCVFDDNPEHPFNVDFAISKNARPPFHNSGRKREYAANLLVYNCRELLMRYNRKFSATGNRTRDPQTGERKYKSRLVKLSALIHELAELPTRRGWEDRSENASHPDWQHETFYGRGISSINMSLEMKRFWDSIASVALMYSKKWRMCSKSVVKLVGIRTVSWSRLQKHR